MFVRTQFALLSLLLSILGCSREASRPIRVPPNNTVSSSEISQNQSRNRSVELAWQFDYEASGRLKFVASSNGAKTTFDYGLDEAGRIQQMRAKRADGSEVVTEFDAYGRRTKMHYASGSVEYEYDSLGRPNRVKRSGAPAISLSHGTSNQLLSIQVGEWRMTYGYDYLERVEWIETPKGKVRFEYTPGGSSRTRVLPNGVRTTWNYEPTGLPKSIVHATPNGKPILQFDYEYLPGGMIQTITESRWALGSRSIKTQSYTYDQLNRLVHAKETGGNQNVDYRYEYDEMGNRTEFDCNQEKHKATFDWAGRLESTDGHPCLIDDASNLIEYMTGRGSIRASFNAAGLLAAAACGSNSAKYQYDGEGRLVARTVDGTTESYLPNPFSDAWCPLLSRSKAGQETFYVWQGSTPLGTLSQNNETWFLENHLGSTCAVLNSDGSVQEFRDYEPFGGVRGQISGKSLTPAFAGMFHDPCSGLQLTRARAYEPSLGQWLQIDPLHRLPMGRQQDLGHFSYCGADPINYVDPDGAAPQDWFEVQRRSTLTVPSIPPNMNREPPKFTWGTLTGEQSAQQWADKYVATQNPVAWIAGVAASAWTPDTYQATTFALTLPVTSASTGVLKAVGLADRVMTVTDASMDLARSGGFKSGAGALIAELGPDVITKGTIAGGKSLILRNLNEAINNGSAGTIVHGLKIADRLQKGAEVLLDGASVAMDTRDFLHDNFGDKNSKPSPIAEFRAALKALHVDRVDTTVFERESNTNYEGGWTPLGRVVEAIAKEKSQGTNTSQKNGTTSSERSSVMGSALTESNVGGVFLAGTKSIEAFGEFIGTYLDKESGTIVLVSKNDKAGNLPPFSLDEFATVLRCVYSGQAPSVSIDPDPNNPHGPTMLVRHGEGTENSQVGQVLYEADRIMKGYSMGLDNLSKRPIETDIPGYAALFSGKPDVRYWSRFWIRPTKVIVRSASHQPLSLFVVPLEVQTESMVLGKDGTLRPAPSGASSVSAKNFSSWFTRNYEAINKETRPPLLRASGAIEPAPIFEELKRIALLTAAAEWMRDQGHPLPAWVRDYPIKPVEIAATTPAIQASHERYSIYGGVSLSGRSEASFENQPLTARDRELASAIDQAVNRLQIMVPQMIQLADGAQFNLTAISGSSGAAPGACQLAESDLEILVDGGHSLAFTRRYHSFFRPDGVLGEGWTLRLPYLEKQPIFDSKNGQTVRFQVKMRLAQDFAPSSDELHFYQNDEPRIDAQALMLLRDDEKLFFNQDTGQLLGTYAGPDLTLCQWSQSKQLTKIERWHESQLRASIQLAYDANGRLQSVRGSNGQSVHYSYSDGRLVEARRSDGSIKNYQYRNGQISQVVRNNKETCNYEFSENGQLRNLVDASGIRTTFRFSSEEINSSDSSIVETQIPGVARIERTTSRSGDRRELLELTTGERHIFEHTANSHSWKMPTGTVVSMRSSKAADSAELYLDDQRAIKFDWDSNGLLNACKTEFAVIKPVYENARLRELTISSLASNGSNEIRIQNNQFGQITGIKQVSGKQNWNADIAYDIANRIATLRDGKHMVDLSWDEHNRLTSNRLSNGDGLQVTYADQSPNINRLAIQDRGAEATLERVDGNHIKLRRFDGGILTASFDEGASGSITATITLPNKMQIEHRISADRKSHTITCGNRYRIEYEFDEEMRIRRIYQRPLKENVAIIE